LTVKPMRVALIISVCLHVALVGISSLFKTKAKRRAVFYAVTLVQQGVRSAESERVQPENIKVQPAPKKKKPPKKDQPPVQKNEHKESPRKVAHLEPEKVKEKGKVKDSSLDYKEVKKAIAQLSQQEEAKREKEALESLKEAVAKIKEKLQEEGVESEQELLEEEQEADERISFRSYGFEASQVGEFYSRHLWLLIKSHWSIPSAAFDLGRDLETRIVVRLSKDGSIQGMEFVKRSGDPVFDNSAWQAIKRVGQFPPFPSHMAVESEEFEVSFVP